MFTISPTPKPDSGTFGKIPKLDGPTQGGTHCVHRWEIIFKISEIIFFYYLGVLNYPPLVTDIYLGVSQSSLIFRTPNSQF